MITAVQESNAGCSAAGCGTQLPSVHGVSRSAVHVLRVASPRLIRRRAMLLRSYVTSSTSRPRSVRVRRVGAAEGVIPRTGAAYGCRSPPPARKPCSAPSAERGTLARPGDGGAAVRRRAVTSPRAGALMQRLAEYDDAAMADARADPATAARVAVTGSATSSRLRQPLPLSRGERADRRGAAMSSGRGFAGSNGVPPRAECGRCVVPARSSAAADGTRPASATESPSGPRPARIASGSRSRLDDCVQRRAGDGAAVPAARLCSTRGLLKHEQTTLAVLVVS